MCRVERTPHRPTCDNSATSVSPAARAGLQDVCSCALHVAGPHVVEPDE